MVRDPVARVISAFFRNFHFHYPELGLSFLRDPRNVERLVEIFMDPDESEHGFAARWFDHEVKDVFGVDVFDTPFPRSGLGQTHACEAGRLIVVRFEDLMEDVPTALGSFFGTEPIELGHHNRSADMPYAESYQAFMARIRLDDAYLDRMYGSRLARHFYDRAELEQLRDRFATTS